MTRVLLLVLLITVAGFLFFTQELHFFKPQQDLVRIGKVIQQDGLVLAKPKNQTNFKNINTNSPVFDDTTIVTGFESYVEIKTLESFRVLDNSSIRLKKMGNKILVFVERGQIQRTKPHELMEFIVQGQAQNELHVQATTKQNLMAFDSKVEIEQDSVASEELQQLDPAFQTQLQQTMKLHQRFFEKCLIKLYEKEKGQIQGGKVIARFTITVKGQISKVSIQKSDFSDLRFQECIKEVISRVQFKNYNRSAITLDFPLVLNLPVQ